ncbi:NusG domain II-containing protein [Streptococcus zalophi]|uniref:NusG domain II-containing protein n=1 Tax=Streptococcus zalophi TaxID=640031 RepID=A0A934P8S7_9STRE|nr:NusG domain II-containing protein [Streptococcus zalophi]MBJ8349084.1 NusG domain II-containing protein [Streptococcus zalophi]MCR8967765.1 NusG domain II-containing protein [Streptococcus zalophi]
MKSILKQLKPFDYVLTFLAILISFIPFTYTYLTVNQMENSKLIATVKIDGKVVDTYELSPNGPHQTKTYYPHEGQYNIVEINQDKIRVKEDNSPDQIAVKSGWIEKSGQILVCLPHQLIIEITGQDSTNPNEEDEIILPLQ